MHDASGLVSAVSWRHIALDLRLKTNDIVGRKGVSILHPAMAYRSVKGPTSGMSGCMLAYPNSMLCATGVDTKGGVAQG